MTVRCCCPDPPPGRGARARFTPRICDLLLAPVCGRVDGSLCSWRTPGYLPDPPVIEPTTAAVPDDVGARLSGRPARSRAVAASLLSSPANLTASPHIHWFCIGRHILEDEMNFETRAVEILIIFL